MERKGIGIEGDSQDSQGDDGRGSDIRGRGRGKISSLKTSYKVYWRWKGRE